MFSKISFVSSVTKTIISHYTVCLIYLFIICLHQLEKKLGEGQTLFSHSLVKTQPPENRWISIAWEVKNKLIELKWMKEMSWQLTAVEKWYNIIAIPLAIMG